MANPVPFGVVELGLLEFGVLGGDADEDTTTEEGLQLPEVVDKREVQVGEETAEVVHLKNDIFISCGKSGWLSIY